MNGTDPQVSIIIVHYNTPELTTALIESIAMMTKGVFFDIVVVDNGSQTARKLRGDSTTTPIKIITSNSNLGFGRAVNLAAKDLSAPFLLFANSDCRLTTNIIPEMVNYLETNPDCAACSTRLLHEDGTVHSSIRRFPNHTNIRWSRGSVLGSRTDYTIIADENRRKVEAMAATFMMVRREDFAQVGGFDERYFMYVEDTDLCRMLHDRGKYVAYLGDLSVVHQWGASTSLHPWRMKFEHHRSIRRYFSKHFPDRKLANAFLSFQLGVNFILVSLKLLRSHREK